MKENRITRAIDVFLDALNEGTLMKGSCEYCAIGNLAQKAIKDSDSFHLDATMWSEKYCTNKRGFTFTPTSLPSLSKQQIEYVDELIHLIPFTLEEQIKIENIFENSCRIHFKDYNIFTKEEVRADQIKGLEAVVKVMLTFDDHDEGLCDDIFTKKAELIEI